LPQSPALSALVMASLGHANAFPTDAAALLEQNTA